MTRSIEETKYLFFKYLPGCNNEVALFKYNNKYGHVEVWATNVPLSIKNNFRDSPFSFDNRDWIFIREYSGDVDE